MSSRSIGVTDQRSLPVYFIPRNLLKVYKPNWKAILAYNALAYASNGAQCRDVALKDLGELVNLSESSMRRGLKELVTLEAVVMKLRFRKTESGGRSALPNEYILVDLPDHSMPI